jgi:hypothetical protein
MRRDPVTMPERNEMRRLRAKKLSVEEIGARLNRSGRCVWDHVKDMPIRCQPGIPARTLAERERFLAAIASGATTEEVGRRFGLAPSSVAATASRLRRKQREQSSAGVA